MTTVGAFLEPPHYGRNELGHVLANVSDRNKKSHDSANSRFTELPDVVQRWEDFDIQTLSSAQPMADCLSKACNVRWVPQIPNIARIIYTERQLEALYLQTLITRVNIALDKAIPPDEDRVTIVLGPGFFECVTSESTTRRLAPDWVVVYGTYDCSMESFPVLQKLAKKGGLLAVGDTKIVRHVDNKALLQTKTCYPDFIRQLQDYCVNLYTGFGFILSNKELIVTRLKREENHSSRENHQRGLRSNTTADQLEPGLPSDVDDSFSNEKALNVSVQVDDPFYDPSLKVPENEDDSCTLPPLPIGRQVIGRQSVRSQSAESQPAESQYIESQYTESQYIESQYTESQYIESQYTESQYIESQSIDSQFIDLQFIDRQFIDSQFISGSLKRSRSSTSSSSSKTERNGHPIEGRRLSGSSHFMPADAQRAHVSDPSQVPSSSSVQQSSSQDYAPSARDDEVGEIKIRNFSMTESVEEGERVSPYKALFLFIMMIRNLKLNGESIAY